MKQENKIENFIGIYDNYLLKDQCEDIIKLFNQQKKFNKTLNRQEFEGSSINNKKDDMLFCGPENIDVWWETCKNIILNFNTAFLHYVKNTGADDAYDHNGFHFTQLKLQKTIPTGGYHQWHIEHMKGTVGETRAFVFAIYLNDVEEGGETEFLHFSKRVKPKTGRIVIWPAGFPYLHRGNPPLSGEKYILTSWMNLRSV